MFDDDDDINDDNDKEQNLMGGGVENITVNIQSAHCRVPLLHSCVHVERRDARTGKG